MDKYGYGISFENQKDEEKDNHKDKITKKTQQVLCVLKGYDSRISIIIIWIWPWWP